MASFFRDGNECFEEQKEEGATQIPAPYTTGNHVETPDGHYPVTGKQQAYNNSANVRQKPHPIALTEVLLLTCPVHN